MARDRELKVVILGDAGRLSSALDGAGRDLDTFSSRMGAAGDRVASTGNRMTLGFTLPVVAGLGAAGKAAADEAQEMAVLERALVNTTGATGDQVAAVEEWVTATQNATGVSDGELRPALAKLVIAGRDVESAQKDMAVALDIATARGVPLEAVVNAMAKAAQGNVGAFGRLGVATKDAAGETLSYDQILQNASRTMGGSAAAAADTTAGRMRIVQAKFADVVEDIGGKVIPIFERVAGVAGSVADGFGELPAPLQNVALGLVGVVAAAGPMLTIGGNLMKVAGGVGSAISGITSAAGSMVTAVGGMGVALGVVGGVLALGAVALKVWTDNKAEARQRTEEFTAALRADNGVIGANSEALIVNSLERENQLDDLAAAGVVIADVTAAVRDETGARAELAGRLEEAGQLNFGLAVSLTRLFETADEAKRKEEERAAAGAASAVVTDDLSGATDELTTALDEATTEADQQAEALRALDQATNDLMGTVLGATEAQISYEQSANRLEDAHAAVLYAQVSLNEATRAHGPASLEARQATEELERAQLDLRSSEVATVQSADSLRAALDTQAIATAGSSRESAALRDRLSELQDRFPELRGTIQPVIDKLNAIPRNVTTTIGVNDQASEYIRGIRTLIGDLPNSVRMEFHGSGDGIGIGGGGGSVRIADDFGPGGTARKLVDIANGFGVPITASSIYRPGAITATGNPSYHGQNRAVDFAGTGANMRTLFEAFRGSPHAPKLKELIYSPAGGTQLRNGAPHLYGEPTRSGHWDHVHVAMAQGGTLQRASRVLVGEYEPEILDLPGGARVTPLSGLSPLPGLAGGAGDGSGVVDAYRSVWDQLVQVTDERGGAVVGSWSHAGDEVARYVDRIDDVVEAGFTHAADNTTKAMKALESAATSLLGTAETAAKRAVQAAAEAGDARNLAQAHAYASGLARGQADELVRNVRAGVR